MAPADGSSDLPGPLSAESRGGRREDPRDALESWRGALESLQHGAASLTEELTALRQGVAGGLRQLRRAELWEAGGSPEQVVETLAAGLEAAQSRLAARAAALVDAQRRAATAATTAVRRLVDDARRAAREAAVPEDLTPVLERLESLGELTRGLLATLRSDVGTLQDRLHAALLEGAGGWESELRSLGQGIADVDRRLTGLAESLEERLTGSTPGGEEGARREVLDTLGAVRALLEDVRLDIKDVSEPALGVLRTLQASMEELSQSLNARLEAAVADISGLRGDDKAARQALARTASALKSEVQALKENIEGWGKPRTAPRLAEEVRRLEARADELDQAIEQRLAPQVASRVRTWLDRRLRTLIGDLPDQLAPTIAEAVQEATVASAEAARKAVREAAQKAVREATEEAVREATQTILDAMRRPAEEPQPRWPAEPGGRRRFFSR